MEADADGCKYIFCSFEKILKFTASAAHVLDLKKESRNSRDSRTISLELLKGLPYISESRCTLTRTKDVEVLDLRKEKEVGSSTYVITNQCQNGRLFGATVSVHLKLLTRMSIAYVYREGGSPELGTRIP